MRQLFFQESQQQLDFIQAIHKIIEKNLPKLTLKLVNKIERSQKTYSCLDVFGDNVYVGTRSSKLYIYKINGIELEDQKFINPHCEVVSSVVANHRFFVTIPECDEESQICVWESKKNTFVTAFKGHKSQISKAIFMRDYQYIATASWDGTTRIWSLQNFENDEHYKLYKGTYPILELQEINKQVLCFGGDDCYLIFWNWAREEVVTKLFGHAGSVTYIYSFLPYLLTCGGDNKFKIWEVSQEMVENHKGEVNSRGQMRMEQESMKSSKSGRAPSEGVETKLSVKMFREDKEQYDSNVFCVSLNETDVFIIDRQGLSFLCKPEKTYKLTNEFEYNENVTGISRYGNLLLISTTKGCIKIFEMKRPVPQVRNEGAPEQELNNESV